MDDKTKIVEISVVGEKALVTFADGKLALLDAAQISSLAVPRSPCRKT